jgi:hypothetical protein
MCDPQIRALKETERVRKHGRRRDYAKIHKDIRIHKNLVFYILESLDSNQGHFEGHQYAFVIFSTQM